MKILEILNYSLISLRNEGGYILKNINFSVERGETLAIIGESGSGKTTIARSILGVLDQNLSVESGEIYFEEKDILKMSEKEKTLLRGNKISLLPQESLNVLDPLIRCGKQIEEMLGSNGTKDKRKSYESVLSMLSLCGFHDPETIFEKYPHELSGGNRQKILFAIANICKPDLLIADEPTSSLDVGSESGILELLKKLKKENNQTILFITHDISIAREISNKIIVLKSGFIIESGTTSEVFEKPKEQYTRLLIDNAKSYN